MDKKIFINNYEISNDAPTFIIAEVSANHMQNIERAKKIIYAAAVAKADAVKLQTYTPDTITMKSEKSYFQITQNTIWDGTTLYKLYEEAYTPWEWQKELMEYANSLGLICFSSPFDFTAVDFMEDLCMPAYKIASFEINDLPLIKKIAQKNKPIIISTGIAFQEDITDALKTCTDYGNEKVILLKCTSSYPSPYEDINLETIPDMREKFDCIVGLSDHTLGSTVAIAAVAKGAKVIEKHLTLKREDGGPDSAFSMEPEEFEKMVSDIRVVEKALGKKTYELTQKQINSREHSRSLFINKDINIGELITQENIRSVRPSYGVHPRYYDFLLGKRAKKDLKFAEPLSFSDIEIDIKIAIILNIGEKIGIGHLKRTIPIAKQLRDKGIVVEWIIETDSKSFSETEIENSEDKIHLINQKNEISNILIENKYNIVFIDRYDINDSDIKEYKKYTNKIAIMDDTDYQKGRKYEDCDIIINPVLDKQQDDDRVLSGFEYVIINDKFKKEREKCVEKEKNKKIITVLSGGSNIHNLSYKITNDIAMNIKDIFYKKNEEYLINVIVGPKSKEEYKESIMSLMKDPNVKVLFDPRNIEQIMAKTDYAITAGGNTVYELNYLGVETFSYTVAENQIMLNEKLDKKNILKYLGAYDNINYDLFYKQLSDDREKNTCKSIVDGAGARRVADKIIGI